MKKNFRVLDFVFFTVAAEERRGNGRKGKKDLYGATSQKKVMSGKLLHGDADASQSPGS